MVGYLQIQKSELLVKEAEMYKAVYCSLCRTIGRDYSLFCRTFLSYDFTFYTVLGMALSRGKCGAFHKGRCCCNPLKSCVYCGDEEVLHMAAAMSVITAYYKICDDISDSKGLKNLFSRTLKTLLKRQYKKSAERYPQLDYVVREMLKNQESVEKSENPTLDACCEPTAVMVAKSFSFLSNDEKQQRVLYEMGYHIGRWIYLADAVDDLQKDMEENNFNCLITRFKDVTDEEQLAAECNSLMNMAIASSYRAFELLTVNKFSGILENHFVYGMTNVQKNLLYKKKGKDRKDNEESI